MSVTLRLSQTTGATPDTFSVEIRVDRDGATNTAQVVVTPGITEADRADIRWYMEDYLEDHYEPNPARAARIEARMVVVGEALFRAIFEANQGARKIWAIIQENLPDSRVEISTTVQDATAIPWELLRDPYTSQFLALDVASFVRVQSETARNSMSVSVEKSGPVRILLVICRPDGGNDVGFRSVAARLVKGLVAARLVKGLKGRERVQLDLLRPPTFEQLSRKLEQAKKDKKPYHVVHFDGHGNYGDHGFLAFENPDGGTKSVHVGGVKLGGLLFRTNVPVLVLNACRSADADAITHAAPASDAHHDMVRAYGSLAQEVVDQGVAGVVAMRYSVYVVTAAQFVGELYTALSTGLTLGQAVTWARKNLSDMPARHIYDEPIDLQDWSVPVVYEAAPICLFPQSTLPTEIVFSITASSSSDAATDGELPPPPDIGFFGRDETLLAIDRAFDRNRVVLLHAYAGSGKTATAAEFARWYRDTGGLGEQPIILFDTFERHRTVRELVDKIGGTFGGVLADNNIQWLSLNEDQRRILALNILGQIPVLWIWDNVEPIAGFPAGMDSSWTKEQQNDLVDFLRALKETRASVLLTSRRDERGWLGDLPTRVTPPPMPRRERRQLAEEMCSRRGQGQRLLKILDPLLEFSGGNPMTLTVLVGQALRERFTTEDQIETFVARLRAGEAKFPDDRAQGRDKSLGASLDYGFDHAFSPDEQCRLALLHLFQGFVDVGALCIMGVPQNPGCVAAVRDLSREAGIALLDRAAEIGLLMTHGGGYYGIHPALPWFLKTLFDRCHPPSGTEPPATRAALAYAWAMGELGNHYHGQFIGGNRDVLGVLQAEEQNLLHACRLALTHDWWEHLFRPMQGLRELYTSGGRWPTWQRLVSEAAPLVATSDGGPRPGREEMWAVVIGYLLDLAGQRHDGAEVVRLLRQAIDVKRPAVDTLLALDGGALTAAQRNQIRSLGASQQRLGTALTEQNDQAALAELTETLELLRHIGDRAAEAIAAFNLGHAYKNITAVRDFDAAEHWYRARLDLRDERDRVGQAKCHSQLGYVALERFNDLRGKPDPDEKELLRQLQLAETSYLQALSLTPAFALAERAAMHNTLAVVYDRAGQTDFAADHYRKAIGDYENVGDRFKAGNARHNLAILLLQTNNLPDALAFARAARNDFASYGPHATKEVAEADALIAIIEQTPNPSP